MDIPALLWNLAEARRNLVIVEHERDEVRAAIVRRSGASSWEEWSKGVWDPTEESAVDATNRLAKERDELRKDKERLDWAEDPANKIHIIDGIAFAPTEEWVILCNPRGNAVKELSRGPTLRAAIDAAMDKETT